MHKLSGQRVRVFRGDFEGMEGVCGTTVKGPADNFIQLLLDPPDRRDRFYVSSGDIEAVEAAVVAPEPSWGEREFDRIEALTSDELTAELEADGAGPDAEDV